MLRHLHLPILLSLLCLPAWLGAQDFEPVTVVCRTGPYLLQSPLPAGGSRQYRWERSFDGGGSWSATGTNAPTLSISSPTAGIRYRLAYANVPVCLADDACRSVTSATELLVRVPTFAQGRSLCAGDTLWVGDEPLTTAGLHETTLRTAAGCDSIVSTFLQLLEATDDLFFVDLCPGESFRGQTYTADTTITERFVAASGCDSLLTFAISVGFATRPTISGPTRVCAGEEAVLEVDGNFSAYAWSNGDADRRTRVLTPGTYQLTLTDFTGCQLTLSHEVTLTELQIDRLTTTPPACPGGTSGRLSLLATGDDDLLYSIDGGESFRMDTVFTGLAAGEYQVVVENADGCAVTASATVADAPELQIFSALPPEQTIERGDSVLADFTASFAVTAWRWNASAFADCADCPAPVLRPTVDTRFVVEATGAGGCSVADTLLIRVNDPRRYYAPTAFSPNGDERNDVWRFFPGPRATSVSGFQVADRWGGIRYQQPVAELPPDEVGWDGTSQGQALPPGTYAWSASINYPEGASRVVRGQITLMR